MNLRQWLDASAAHDAEYGHSLASHLPMALVALNRLGANELRLASFAERYSKRLHPAPPAAAWPAGDPWPNRLGDPAAWPAYRTLFNEWFDHEGATSVLPQVLPRLMQGVGAAAFHGPIRVAYALAAGHSHELADALAYWACRWFSVSPPLAGLRTAARTRPADAASALSALTLPPLPGSLIAERMALAARHPAFARCFAAGQPAVDTEAQVGQSLRAWAELAAMLYAASGNFTVLHLVTSAHAMRKLLPWLDEADRPGALGHYWAAYVAGCAASRLELPVVVPAAAAAAAQTLRHWPEIVAQAVASDDDHLIKIVDVCREEERHHGGTLWLAAASRAVMQ